MCIHAYEITHNEPLTWSNKYCDQSYTNINAHELSDLGVKGPYCNNHIRTKQNLAGDYLSPSRRP